MKNKLIIIGVLFSLISINSKSQEFSTLGEIYNFEINDEFHFLHYYCCNDLSFQLQKQTIINKQVNNNIIVYNCLTSVFDFINTTPPVLSDTSVFQRLDTITILYPDSIIFGPEDTVIISPDLYNGRKICVNKTFVLNSLMIKKYVDGCGLALFGWKDYFNNSCSLTDSLIYYKKDNKEWGKTLLRNSSHELNPQLQIYPNPVKDFLFIKNLNPNTKIQDISIISAEGKEVLNGRYNSVENNGEIKLDLSIIPKGLYFVYFSTNNVIIANPIIKI